MTNDVHFSSKAVKAFVKETAKMGGDTKKIDTKAECDKLAQYLANNRDNMSQHDQNIFADLIQFNNNTPSEEVTPTTVNVKGDNNSVNYGDSTVEIHGDVHNGSGNFAIGIGNQQNQDTTNNTEVKDSTPKPPAQKKAATKAAGATPKTPKKTPKQKTPTTPQEPQEANTAEDSHERVRCPKPNQGNEFIRGVWKIGPVVTDNGDPSIYSTGREKK